MQKKIKSSLGKVSRAVKRAKKVAPKSKRQVAIAKKFAGEMMKKPMISLM